MQPRRRFSNSKRRHFEDMLNPQLEPFTVVEATAFETVLEYVDLSVCHAPILSTADAPLPFGGRL